MGRVVQEFLDNWGAGVVTTLPPDLIPPTASPRAWNTELTQAGGDRAIIRKRKGIIALLDDPLSGAAVLGQYYFRPKVNGVYTPIQLAYTADGCLWNIAGSVGTCLDVRLAQDTWPEFAQAQNLCFVVNGTDRYKVLDDGATIQNFGIDRPASAPSASAGAAGSMTGTYDLAFTYYNSATGHESSRSDTITVSGLTSKKINVTIPDYAGTAVPTVTATGGTTTTLADGSKLHTFTSGANFVVSGGSLTVEYLLVAGGGGGGAATNDQAAGGGAGGQVLAGTATLAAGTYAVTVGALGAGGTVAGTATGSTGGNSTFNGLTARGGSGGGGSETAGVSGYLGGGGGSDSGGLSGGTGSIYAGGDGGSNGGGGGAGAGGAGGDSPGFGVGGSGGTGVYSSITGTAVGYGGGGSGAGYADAGTVGDFGGGRGATYSGAGSAATALRGAGGGGGRFSSNGGNGSAGVVYLRYSDAPPVTLVPDEQVDTVRVHIRKQSTNAYLFRVNTGTGYDADTGGWPVGYGSVALDLTDAQLEALTELTPDISENDRPPAGITHLCWHNSRMFAADDTTLYYSKTAKPEAFDADFFEYINPNDGQEITAIKSIGGVLVIFKTHSIWGLFGDDPNNWYLRNLDPKTGCASARSIVTVEGKTYWWSEQGPWVWSEGSEPFPIGKELLQPTISTDALNPAAFDGVCAAVDNTNSRILFAVPSLSATRNDQILPFSYRLNRWEASKWDPMDTASLCDFVDADGFPFVALGNYAGELFRVSYGDVDGVDSGTMEGTFSFDATYALTITDAGAAFQTNLAERRVTVVDSNGIYVARRRIVSNTATSLTLDSALPLTLTQGQSYTYYVGGPDFQFDTRWATFDLPFYKKRFEYGFFEGLSGSGVTLDVELRFDYNPESGQIKRLTLTGLDTTWDASIWTDAVYGTAVRTTQRFRIGRTGRAWSLRLRNPAPNAPITVYKVGMQAETMTTKR